MPLRNKDEALDWLEGVEGNKPLSNGTHRFSQYSWGRCDALVRKCRQKEDVNFHRTALSKYAAYLKLRNALFIWLFHGIYWRYLYGFKSPDWVRSTLEIPLDTDQADSADFFVSWSWIRRNHLTTEMMSKTLNTMTTEAKQDSEADTTL